MVNRHGVAGIDRHHFFGYVMIEMLGGLDEIPGVLRAGLVEFLQLSRRPY